MHYEDLNTSNKTSINSLYTTSAKKTFQDLISSDSYHPEWIKQNLRTAMEKNLISLKEVKTISVHGKAKQILNAILFELSD